MPPSYRYRSAKEIVSSHIYEDAVGYCYRAVSWLDLAERESLPAAITYAATDGRLSIEHLLFEQLVISSLDTFGEEEYRQCVGNATKLHAALKRITPDYEKLQGFTQIIVSLDANAPAVNCWNIPSLMKSWGILSNVLHWPGAKDQTWESEKWLADQLNRTKDVLLPLWEKHCSGSSGVLLPSNMPKEVYEVWELFRSGDIDAESVSIRLSLLRPMLHR